mgnify:CR=1 FL=1
MRWCEKHDVFYIFGLARNPVLERRIDPLMEKVETVFEATGEQQRLFDEIQYAAETWGRQRASDGWSQHPLHRDQSERSSAGAL